MKMRSVHLLTGSALLLGLLALAPAARASSIPPIPSGFSWTQTGGPVDFAVSVGASAGKVSMSEFSYATAQPISLPPSGGAPAITTSFFDIFLELSLNGVPAGGVALSGQPSPPDVRSMSVQFDAPLGGGSDNPTESVSFSFQSSSLPGLSNGVMIRESPTKQSLGQTQITDTGGGNFRISSFFDVFTELSLDGGHSWTPASSALSLTSPAPLPSTAWAGIALLGCLGLTRIYRHARGSKVTPTI